MPMTNEIIKDQLVIGFYDIGSKAVFVGFISDEVLQRAYLRRDVGECGLDDLSSLRIMRLESATNSTTPLKQLEDCLVRSWDMVKADPAEIETMGVVYPMESTTESEMA